MPATNCGATSVALAACSRHSVANRYGERVCSTVLATGRGGSATTTTTSTAITRHSTAGKTSAARKPQRAASGGRVSDARPMPSGVHVCRMPIASPRSRTLNQPSTARPLAALIDAEKSPASANPAPSATRPGSARLTSSTTPVPTMPMVSTIRSPNRSAAAPHAISPASRPSTGVTTSTPAWVSVTCSDSWSRGMRNGSP